METIKQLARRPNREAASNVAQKSVKRRSKKANVTSAEREVALEEIIIRLGNMSAAATDEVGLEVPPQEPDMPSQGTNSSVMGKIRQATVATDVDGEQNKEPYSEKPNQGSMSEKSTEEPPPDKSTEEPATNRNPSVNKHDHSVKATKGTDDNNRDGESERPHTEMVNAEDRITPEKGTKRGRKAATSAETEEQPRERPKRVRKETIRYGTNYYRKRHGMEPFITGKDKNATM